MKIIVVGGGWAGCAAAYMAATQHCEVILLERTDLLLGTGLVGGIMRNNGRYTATEEMIAMGGGELFHIVDANLRHKNVQFPEHEHACLYDITRVPDAIYQYLMQLGVEIHFSSHVNRISENNTQKPIHHILDVSCDDGHKYSGDAFIDATGTCGPMKSCINNGNGCAMCVMRCPSFGPRQSLAALLGLKEVSGYRSNGLPGSISGSCKLLKESLSGEIITTLNEKGVVIIPIPKELQLDHLADKSCQQYAYPSYMENLILLDTGHAKLMTPFYPIQYLKQIPGFEHARYEDPYSASIGNSIRFTACCLRDNSLKVNDTDNLFCAGEKAGLLVGHTEAIVTGVLAGYNASRYCKQLSPLILPNSLCTGALISYSNEKMKTEKGLQYKYTFSGSVFFDYMKNNNLYTIDIEDITNRVSSAGLLGVMS